MCVQFGAAELERFHGVKRAFDPKGLLNPGKAVPTLRAAPNMAACACTAASCRTPSCPLLTVEEFQDRIRAAAAGEEGAALRGGGTKDFYGNSLEGEILDTRGYAGIVSYEPTGSSSPPVAAPACRAREKPRRQRQCLLFEPPHFGAGATVGGCVAAGFRAAARARGRAARFRARRKDGRRRGQALAFGGQVMKNVAGYDVSRLIAGSLGTLGVIAEVSLKIGRVRPPRRRCGWNSPTSARLISSTAGPASRFRSAPPPGTTASCPAVGVGARVRAAAARIGGDPVQEPP